MFQIKWLWENLKGYRAVYILALSLSVVSNALILIAPIFSAIIVDTFITNDNALDNLTNQRSLLIWLLIGLIGFTFLKSVISFLCSMTYETSSQGLIVKLRAKIFRNVLHQDMSFYNNNRTGDLMTRLTGDLDMVRHMVSWVLKGIIESVTLFLAATVYFYIVNWKMAICLTILTPAIFFISVKLKNKVGPVYVDLREKLAGMNTAAQENISGNRVVKAFAREDHEINKFEERNKNFLTANKKSAFIWLNFSPALEGIAVGLSVIMLLCGGLFLIFGDLTMGEYIAISGLIWAVTNPMKSLGIYINDAQRFMASASKIIDIYYAKPTIHSKEDADKTPIKGNIEFKNVTFRYNSTNVLKDINFTIKAGETVAIMGETGSGKTTLINLIPRFYDVTKGDVLVDGVNVKDRDLTALRQKIGIATQDVLLFSDTIDGNIAYGDSSLSQEEVINCAKLSDADDFIRKTDEGYDTIVGERGVGLSGGQKQRISLARAIAIKPPILILDDTTSAVDLETEKHIQNSLNSLDFNPTKIIIAQRISSTKDADKIIVLDNGRIKEMGTHKELISQKGYYYDVFKLQNEGYEEVNDNG